MSDVTVGSSHFDTTSLSVYGEYENQDCENAIEVVLGYSKDRRPDLKQIQFGIGVTREGVLNYGEVLSGNSSDKTWNRKALGKVKTMFPPEILKDLIYVADSSLVTDENLKEAGNQVKFISRMPATYGLVAETIKKAWDLDLWEPAGSYASRKEAAEYWVYETVHRMGEIDYRLIAVRSSSLDSRKEKSIMKRVEKARAAIAKEAKELAGRDFVCEPDARRAAELFMDRHAQRFHELSFEVTEETIREKRARRGRPRKDEQPPAETAVYRASVTIDGIDQGQVEQARERESCFVLITNLMDADKYPASSILGEYKQQSRVEARFSFLKSPYLLGQVFLKKQSRIEALGYVLLMALFIATLLERRVRNNLEAEGTPIMIPGKRNTMRPTARMILDMLDTVQVAHVEHEGIVRRVWMDSRHGFDIPRLLRLAGFAADIYTDPSLTRLSGPSPNAQMGTSTCGT